MSQTPSNPVALETRAQLGGKLHSPSAARNRDAIAGVLAQYLPERARVLEFGSGTGEHAARLLDLRPDVCWQPSDPDARSRASQSAWAAETGERMAAPLDLDLTRPGWSDGLPRFDALVSCNVIHISPIAVLEAIASCAQRLVTPGGLVFFYGPFLEGARTAPSNLDFDRSLQARNPAWGVRSLGQVTGAMEQGGFAALTRLEMPANNRSLIFTRQGSSNAPS